MRQNNLSHEFVEYIPELLKEGVLYISQQYGTAVHKCCCGCNEEVITPINPTGWTLWIEGNTITLDPSIGNWSYKCHSHYWIRRSKVIWAGQMSKQDIEQGRIIDQKNKDAYFKELNRNKNIQSHNLSRLIYKMWHMFKRWFK